MWSDGRAQPPRVISKEPKLKGSDSLGICTAQESVVRAPEHIEGMSRVSAQPSTCGRDADWFQTEDLHWRTFHSLPPSPFTEQRLETKSASGG